MFFDGDISLTYFYNIYEWNFRLGGGGGGGGGGSISL